MELALGLLGGYIQLQRSYHLLAHRKGECRSAIEFLCADPVEGTNSLLWDVYRYVYICIHIEVCVYIYIKRYVCIILYI